MKRSAGRNREASSLRPRRRGFGRDADFFITETSEWKGKEDHIHIVFKNLNTI
jgi:hypothetical protein